MQEIQLMASLSDAEVMNVHEIFAPAHHIVFMEHIPNGELFDVLASQEASVAGKPLTEGTSRRILRDLISGMSECYRFGVTHRDLKRPPQQKLQQLAKPFELNTARKHRLKNAQELVVGSA